MPRRRTHTRRRPRSNPRGIIAFRKNNAAFVTTAEGEFFIPASKLNGAFEGDFVEVLPLNAKHASGAQEAKPSQAKRNPAARVLRVLDRAHTVVVGRYEVADPFGVVVPEDRRIPYDIFTRRADRPDVPDGALVRVRITEFPTRKNAATGFIEDVLGMADDPASLVELVIARHKLETKFSDAACEEARAVQVLPDETLAQGYRDLRNRFVMTIDPADARDFDDALSLDRVETKAGARWRLGVHIADVSHYVSWGSALDLDARKRATSVYLVDRVIPMLPEELSCGVCSLAPGEVRRALTVDVVLTDDAAVESYEIYPSLIVSKRRLTYDEALDSLRQGQAMGVFNQLSNTQGQAILAQEPLGETQGRPNEAQRQTNETQGRPDNALRFRLCQLSRIAKARAEARHERGGLEFSSLEAKMVLDDQGVPIDVSLRVKTDATELVEEAMILANELVAAHLSERKFPCMYRVHDRPAADALAALLPVLQEFSWFRSVDQASFVAGKLKAVQQVLSACAGRAEEELVSSLVLRSMMRAVYKPENEGHYALASSAYAHFTSPIRRYPDLVVHRMVKAQLYGAPQNFKEQREACAWLASHASQMERVAERAAKESQTIKLIEYLEAQVGQRFSALICGVATYGVFVRLDNTAEGLLPTEALGHEYFALNAQRYWLEGQESGVRYRLGQRVAVVLVSADPRAGRLEFRLA